MDGNFRTTLSPKNVGIDSNARLHDGAIVFTKESC